MKSINKEELREILRKHKLWLDSDEGGERADLRCADLRCANLSDADLSGADLSDADLRCANLSDANLRGANLRYANLSDANLRYANLSDADLRYANLSDADLSGADLSGAKNLISAINYMEAHFERTVDGYIAYKTFNGSYAAPVRWKIEAGSVIDEVVNQNRTTMCGSGINVAPLEWVRREYRNQTIWKVLIRWEWLPGVCVPYNTDGKIRCERAELVEIVK